MTYFHDNRVRNVGPSRFLGFLGLLGCASRTHVLMRTYVRRGLVDPACSETARQILKKTIIIISLS